MPVVYKVLGQSAPAAVTATTLYTTPASTSTLISTLNVSNRSAATADSVRVAVRPAGAALANQHYIVYDVQVPPAAILTLTAGLTLATTDVVTVYSTTGNSTFNAFGSEIS